MGGRFLGEPAFSHSGLAGEREQAAATGDCAVDSGADFVQFPASADEGLSGANGIQTAHLHVVPAATANQHTLTNFEA